MWSTVILKSVTTSLVLALDVLAISVPSPVDLIRRAHTTGAVITKCSKPGVLALAFDDGPYTCGYSQQPLGMLASR
jgi:hypothetical protein